MREGTTADGAISHREGLTMDLSASARASGPPGSVSLTGWEIAPNGGAEPLAGWSKPHLTGIDLGAPDQTDNESRQMRAARRPQRRST